jgi:hypothetical protein
LIVHGMPLRESGAADFDARYGSFASTLARRLYSGRSEFSLCIPE